jgi:hypothetical protein
VLPLGRQVKIDTFLSQKKEKRKKTKENNKVKRHVLGLHTPDPSRYNKNGTIKPRLRF